MNKLERLMKLLTALLDTTQPLSAEMLRSRIGGYSDKDDSFRRAFERDKDDLRRMGVEILVRTVPETEPPIDGYLVDQDEYAGQDPGLTSEELAALHLAAALVRLDTLGNDTVGSDTLWKLGGASRAASADGAPGVQVKTGEETELAAIFHDAIAARQVVRFGYGDLDRAVEPARLTFTSGHWYVSGFDQARDDDRVFRIDRVVGPVQVGSSNAFPTRSARGPQVTRTWELGDEEPRAVSVQIEQAMVSTARLQLHDDEIEEQADGSIIATLDVANSDRFRDWVLTFYDNAVVLSPPEMRQVMVDWFNEMAAP